MQEIENKTIIGNSLEVMPLLPNSFADLVIADPPYNMNKVFGENACAVLRVRREGATKVL